MKKAGVKYVWIFCAIMLLVGLTPMKSYAQVGSNGQGSAYDAIISNESQKPAADQTKSTLTENPPAESVKLPGSNTPSMWGFLLQVVFSLGIVILLIYLLMRFLSKRQIGGGLRQSGPFRMIGGAPLGNNKSLQIVKIGEALYVLGVGENIQLLRHIPAGDEVDLILADAEIKPDNENPLEGLLGMLRGKKEQETTEFTLREEASGSFEELLEKQWDEVKLAEDNDGRWEYGQDRNKGAKS